MQGAKSGADRAIFVSSGDFSKDSIEYAHEEKIKLYRFLNGWKITNAILEVVYCVSKNLRDYKSQTMIWEYRINSDYPITISSNTSNSLRLFIVLIFQCARVDIFAALTSLPVMGCFILYLSVTRQATTPQTGNWLCVSTGMSVKAIRASARHIRRNSVLSLVGMDNRLHKRSPGRPPFCMARLYCDFSSLSVFRL